jgi:L-amino acid N-acyltransferase YncA
MPDDLRIVPASYDDLPDVARIHVASWKEAYIGQAPQAYLDNLDVTRRVRAWQEQFPNRDVSGLLVAKMDNKLAGFVCYGCGRDEDRYTWGEIYAIYLLKEYWRRGVGYELYKKACAGLREKDFERAYLWVLDTNNHAIAAYRQWGGMVEQDRLKDHAIGGQPVKEVSIRFDFSCG